MAEQTAPSGEYFFSKSKVITIIGLLVLCTTACGADRDQSGNVIPNDIIKCTEVSDDKPESAAAGSKPWKTTVVKEDGTRFVFYAKETKGGVSYSEELTGTYKSFKNEETILNTEDLELVASRGLLGSSVQVIC